MVSYLCPYNLLWNTKDLNKKKPGEEGDTVDLYIRRPTWAEKGTLLQMLRSVNCLLSNCREMA